MSNFKKSILVFVKHSPGLPQKDGDGWGGGGRGEEEGGLRKMGKESKTNFQKSQKKKTFKVL